MFWKQLGLLLWKNTILRRRHWLRTLVEIVWPLVLFAILIAIRKTQLVETVGECHYRARAMPSAGVYPWLRGLICDLQNPCFSSELPSEVPGQINDPNNSNSSSVLSLLALLNPQSNLNQPLSNLQSLNSISQEISDNANLGLTGAQLLAAVLTNNQTVLQNLSQEQLTNLTDGITNAFQSAQSSASSLSSLSNQLQSLSNFDTSSFLTNLCDYEGISATSSVAAVTAVSAFQSIGSSGTLNLNPNNTNFCTDLISTFEDNDQYRFFWDSVKPLLLGKIPYSPNSPLVQSIIKRANSTFESLAFLEASGRSWESTIGPGIYQSLESGNATTSLRTLLDSASTNLAVAALLGIPTATLDQLRTFLSNDDNPNDSVTTWKDLYRQFDNLILLITKFLQCIELDKFVGFSDETQLVDYSLQKVTDRTLWGGVVFLNPTSSMDTLPNVVKYKIRQDAGYVTRTTSIQRFFWRPGAESGSSIVKYYDSGFVHIQDMIEKAIVETSLNSTGSLDTLYDLLFGNYLVEMPYPCYTRDSYWKPEANADGPDNDMAYYFGGFLFLQDIIDRSIIDTTTNSDSANAVVDPMTFMGVYMQEFPYPCYTYDEFLEYLAVMLSLLLTLAWIYSVCVIIKNIVYEKEQRLKEVMKMMGLSNGVHWVAWFIDSFLIMFCSVLLLLILLWAGAITPYSNMFIVGLWLSCFAIATITLCFLISVFFSRANLAAACGGIIFFLLYIPYNMVYTFEDEMTFATKIIACLLSNVAFGYGATYISQYEMSGDGIQFYNWNTSPNPNDQLTFVISLVMMLVDAVLYMLIAWYVENVFPGAYGVPRPWYFFVTRSYWCGLSKRVKSDVGQFSSVVNDPNVQLEGEPQNLPLGVSIHNLRKVYDNGKVAVDDLSLNFYEGQITSFLGHNGAGKTTTMSMLTGLFTPTSGTGIIYGNDIRIEMDEIRHQLGFCPQHNVLFGDLTVMEHLKFYSGLKAAVGGVVENSDEIDKMLLDVGLPHKKNEVSRHLSGGMKRKLSVAVAFVGGSKCVILDEPTAGVDPYARRGIWDLLLRYRSNRTIILSTHHMDEADLLGDRIAIISHGRLKCCGSSLFLKSSFGVGYYLTVVKDADNSKEDLHTPSLTSLKESNVSSKDSDEGFESEKASLYPPPSAASSSSLSSSSASSSGSLTPVNSEPNYLNDAARSSHISNIVLKTVKNSKIHEENPHEVTFILPYSAQADGKFSEVFERLDQLKLNYGLTDTSLEEIFLNVAEQSQDEGKEEKSKCCCCIPRRKKGAVAATAPSSEDQARRIGSRRSMRSPSVTSRDSLNDSQALLYRADQSIHPSTANDEAVAGGIGDGSLGKGSYKITGNRLVWQQFSALFIKRFHHSKRNKKGVIAQVIVPAGFIALALVFSLIVPQIKSFPPLELQPWMYGNTSTFFSEDMTDSSLASNVSAALLDSPTLGLRCVSSYVVQNYDDKIIYCERQNNSDWELPAGLGSLSQMNGSRTEVCQCTDKDSRVLLAECPVAAGGSATPRSTLQSSDYMYNMTGRNVSDWLVKSVEQFIQARYGGLSLGERYHQAITVDQLNSLIQVIEANSNFSFANLTSDNQTVAALLESFARSENAKVWFDNNGYHSMPTWLNILNNAALRSSLPPGKDPRNLGIAVVNHPLNFTSSTVDLAALSQSITDTLISISVIFALSFVPASFVLFLIDEKVTKAKHLQFVSGVNQTVYWIATFLWDMVNYLVPTIIVLIIFLCFQTKAYVSSDNFPCLFLLLFLYGFAITPMMYPATFYFEVPSTAYVVLTCINLFIGINTSIATFILELLDDPALTAVNDVLVKVFLVFPQYCLGRGLIDMALNQAYADAYASFGVTDRFIPPLTFDLVGKNLLAMAIEGVGFFILTLLIQHRFFIKPRTFSRQQTEGAFDAGHCDEDVLAEKQRLLSNRSNDILQVKNLTKVFKKAGTNKNLIAVDRLCFGVPEGECFGLLGVNGAGKTTTFKMLTGDILPSAGDASVCSQSILDHIRDVQQNTGYCPQFEALNSLLTGREHLIFYARLRGVPPEDVFRVADWGIDNFGLKQYANKPAGTYSGGNKRKLNAAIAFIGCPPVVFLDEPTAGMDPMSRRFLWGRISEAVRGGRCIILTSHSMEECEALCTRLAIMVNGKLRCIGSPQHLKIKYGEGYTVTIKVAGSNPDFEIVQSFIDECFPTAVLKESHCNMMMYQLPLRDVKLKYLFEMLQQRKDKLNIEDYSISQTTLDEVFVSFAQDQTDGVEVGEPALSMNTNASNHVAHTDDIVMQNMYVNFKPTNEAAV